MIGKVILICCILIFVVAWAGFPDIIKCPYKARTGLPCLFCGTTTNLLHVINSRAGIFIFLGLLVLLCKSIYERH